MKVKNILSFNKLFELAGLNLYGMIEKVYQSKSAVLCETFYARKIKLSVG